MRLLICVLLLFLTGWLSAAAKAPRVMAVGTYAAAYVPIYAHAGCEFQVMTPEEFMATDTLDQFDLIHLAHWGEMPQEAQEKLYRYQQNGGNLLFTLGSIPDRKFFGTDRPMVAKSGWTGDLISDPAAFPEAGGEATQFSYRRWGSTLEGIHQLPQVSVLAFWMVPEEKGVNIDPAFQGKVPAVYVIHPSGNEGKVFYAGAYLASPGCNDILYGIVHRLFPETDVFYDLIANLRAFSPEPQIPGPVGSSVAVAAEAGFPSAGLPGDVTPESIVKALHDAGIAAETVSFAAVEAGLPVERYGALVLPYGENMAVECYKGIGRYIANGGGLVNAAGLPLSRPHRFKDGQWQEIGNGELVEKISYQVFQRLLPIGKYFSTPATDNRIVNLNSAWLPHLPAVWEIPSGAGNAILPWTEYTYECQVNLLGAADAAGEIGSYALWFPLFNDRYPYSPMVFCTLAGAEHPWSEAAHAWAPDAIADMVRLALRRDYLYISNVTTREAGYHPGERVEIIGEVRGMQAQDATIAIQVYSAGADQPLWSQELTGAVEPGKNWRFETAFQLPAEAQGAYDVIASLKDTALPVPANRAMFYALTPEQPSRNRAGFDQGLPTENGRPIRLSGVNIYSNEGRSLGVFFLGWNRQHLPALWERDMTLVRLAGGNAIRQHYLEEMFREDNFSATGDSSEERVLASFLRLADDQNLLVSLAPMTFAPNFFKSWQDRLGDTDYPYADSKWVDAVMRYYELLGRRTANFRHVFWEVLNEPEFHTPAGKEGQSTQDIRQWAQMAAKRLQPDGTPVGLGHITCDESTLWNSHENLRGIISWNHTHSYSADEVRPGGVESTPYSLNFGRPAIIGEIGMPNSESSLNAKLGEWGEFYERTLALILGEHGIGFQNFYLANRQLGNDPEWGLLRGDLTEKEEFKVWKLWNIVNRELPPERYLPQREALIYFQADRDAAISRINGLMREMYVAFVLAGHHPQLLSSAEVDPAKAEFDRVWILSTDATRPEAEQLRSKWRQAQVEVIDLNSEWKPEPLQCARPLAAFDYTYELPQKDGGATWILVGAVTPEVNFTAGKHSYRCTLQPGSSLILDLTPAGEPRLLQMTGHCAIDGRDVVNSERRWLLWTGNDSGLLTPGAPIQLWADDPLAVKTTVTLAQPLPERCRVFLTGADAGELAPLVQEAFARRNWSLVSSEAEADYVIRLAAADQLSAQLKPRTLEAPEILWDGKRLIGNLAALLEVGADRADIHAGNRAARYLALLRLASLQQCGTYTTGPFTRQK